jgi:hypothetical protein
MEESSFIAIQTQTLSIPVDPKISHRVTFRAAVRLGAHVAGVGFVKAQVNGHDGSFSGMSGTS